MLFNAQKLEEEDTPGLFLSTIILLCNFFSSHIAVAGHDLANLFKLRCEVTKEISRALKTRLIAKFIGCLAYKGMKNHRFFNFYFAKISRTSDMVCDKKIESSNF
jgi:hypothetical protein